MGAVDTMDQFFDLLNAGQREDALKLMDERVEMRIHVGENARTLRGIDQVGGWFLRAEKGLRMIAANQRDMGASYECDLMVLRPGAASQFLDATFRVDTGKITAINLAPR